MSVFLRTTLGVAGRLLVQSLVFLGRSLRQLIVYPFERDVYIGLLAVLVIFFFPQILSLGILVLVVAASFAWMLGGMGRARPFLMRALVLAGIIAAIAAFRGS